ncbi:inosine/xanthosine triphosphatase [Salinirubrum litoreum]|uniref:Probable inosine/xanthosine triphosphatase n=1 Tax=Salinirubrum litoreum TaxID=1126234 RepID=A0ABD5RD85_9EURY|nr:inosine/xanthosine triphosphatase [Salinirubrum litoreum]
MRVGVGSGNPVKRRAVTRVVVDDATVESVPVESGVGEQPRGHAETIEGAETRAANVLVADSDYDFGVGIEGGVAEFEGTDGLFLVMWAAVTDGGRVGHGAGPSLRLPTSIAERVRDGAELGPVMDDVLGTEGIAEREGAAGALTDGRIDREEALSTAVAGALGPFVTDFY